MNDGFCFSDLSFCFPAGHVVRLLSFWKTEYCSPGRKLDFLCLGRACLSAADGPQYPGELAARTLDPEVPSESPPGRRGRPEPRHAGGIQIRGYAGIIAEQHFSDRTAHAPDCPAPRHFILHVPGSLLCH